eukprot:PhM_4_TR16074/c0_g1_i1/m.94362
MALPTDKQFEEIQAHSQNFDTYDKQFTEVLIDLEGNGMLDTFRREYDQLHTSFVKSHEGERRLIKKCQDLQIEIVACQYKIRTAEDLSQGDKATIETLRKEIVKAKQKYEQSKETEVTLKEKIKQLNSEVTDLDRQLQKGVSGAQKHEAHLTDLNRMQRQLQKELDTHKSQLVAIQHDITHLRNKHGKVEAHNQELEDTIRTLRETHFSKQQEIEHHREDKKSFSHELDLLKEELLAHIAESQLRATNITNGMAAIKKLQRQVAEQRDQLQKQHKLFEEVNKEAHALEQENEQLEAQNKQQKQRAKQQEQLVRAKEAEVHSIRTETERIYKQVDAITKTNSALEIQKHEVEGQRNTNKHEIQRLEQEKSAGQRYVENDQKQIEDLTRERDILDKSYLKAQGATQRQRDWLNIKENQIRNLEHQLRGYEREAQKQREMVNQLEKETQAYISDGTTAAQKFMKAIDELNTHEQHITASQTRIHESESKLKQQQTLFESVLNERNMYSKNLLDLNQQIVEMDTQLEIIEQQINQLKDDITKKDEDTTREDIHLQTLEKEKEEYRQKIKRTTTLIQAKDRKIGQLNQEVNKLNEIIAEADLEKSKQHRDCENVTNERDILGMQLIRRNDELAQLYERIRIQQSALKKGEAQFRLRMVELTQFEEKRRLLYAQLASIKAMAARLPQVRTMLNRATKDLNRAKLRVRVLIDECENPSNVHRWRHMAGSQPATYKQHKRMRELQAELIQKHEEVEVKARLIKEKEQLYMELKSVLARQPGPEVAEQLNVYQDTVSKKTGQLKAMKESLRHFEQQLHQHESRYSELNQAMKTMRSSYRTQRKREKQEDERQRLLAEIMGKAPGDINGGREEVYVGHTAAPLPPRQRADEQDGAQAAADDVEVHPLDALDGDVDDDDDNDAGIDQHDQEEVVPPPPPQQEHVEQEENADGVAGATTEDLDVSAVPHHNDDGDDDDAVEDADGAHPIIDGTAEHSDDANHIPGENGDEEDNAAPLEDAVDEEGAAAAVHDDEDEEIREAEEQPGTEEQQS